MTTILLKGIFASAQGTPYPGQPLTGPGGAEYTHQSVAMYDHGTAADGYWLFEPADPKPDSAHVVIFMHGYGAYNPMCYGKWIKHLVSKGNIVIYPRYQKNLLMPHASRFPKNAAKGIHDALEVLKTEQHVRPILDNVAYVGHSYGGTICANFGVNWKKYHLPRPAAMLLCQPGTGPLKGARLDDYRDMDPDLQLIVVVGQDDYVVGDELGGRIFLTAVNTPNRNLVRHLRDTNGVRSITAFHSEPYCYDLDFDIGVRNYTAMRVFQSSRLNEIDFNCYWKFLDALIDHTREGKNADIAFGNTPAQRSLGNWPDGKPIKELEVILPGALNAALTPVEPEVGTHK